LTGHTVQLLDVATRSVTQLAGLSGYPGYTDGTGADARFNRPYGLALLGNDVIVSDNWNHVLRRVALDGTVTTYAGAGSPGMVDGPVGSALFTYPQDVAIDAQGNLYVDDSGNHRIRVIHNGQVRTLAGTGEASYADGPGTSARFFGHEGLDVSPDGTSVYVADGNGGDPGPYHRIRLISVPSLD
jgi:DNA-binding beta-propeller fold protein YncE